jgi:hypothetical protein
MLHVKRIMVILCGILAFVVGVWCFVRSVHSLVAFQPPTPRPVDTSEPSAEAPPPKAAQTPTESPSTQTVAPPTSPPAETATRPQATAGTTKPGGKSTTLSPAAPAKERGVTTTKASNATVSLKSSSKLTRENFDQIVNGMTEDEVTAICGPPNGTSTKQGTFNGQPFKTRMLTTP